MCLFASQPEAGKSLCYWILPGVFGRLLVRGPGRPSIVVVVSPLKALMREQVEALKGRGSRAVYVHGGRFVRRSRTG